MMNEQAIEDLKSQKELGLSATAPYAQTKPPIEAIVTSLVDRLAPSPQQSLEFTRHHLGEAALGSHLASQTENVILGYD